MLLNCGVETLESPLDCKKIQLVHPKGYQSWLFIGRTDTEAETPILWPPDVKSWLIGKDSDAGRDWGQEEKGPTEDEMVARHQWRNGRESEQTPEVVKDRKACHVAVHEVAELDTSKWLNNNNKQLPLDSRNRFGSCLKFYLVAEILSSVSTVWLSHVKLPVFDCFDLQKLAASCNSA